MIAKETLLALAVKKAEEHGLDHELVLAFCEVESGYNPYAIRYEPEWHYTKLPAGYALRLGITMATENVLQSCSFGLMQVMGTKFRELGFTDHLTKIIAEPELQLEYGCKIIKNLIELYDNLDDAIAAYNAGSPRKEANGKYSNQQYVDKIKKALEGKNWSQTNLQGA